MTFDSLSNFERQQNILKFLSQKHRISVNDICKLFSISEATARRDLEVLAEHNQIQRVHGGAILLPKAPLEPPMLQRGLKQADEKRRIAKVASRMIRDGETVFLGSGTTVYEMVKELLDFKELTIVTNSLPVMNLLSGRSNISVVGLGGFLRESELSFIGHITEQALSEIRVEKVFIGIHAIHIDHGLTSNYLPETMTDRAILKAGNEVIVVADHTKVNMVSTAFLTPLDNIHKLVTDSGTPGEFIFALRGLGIEVVIA